MPTEEINKTITEQDFQAAVMPSAENRLGIGAFGKKGKKTLESLVKLLEKRYKVSSEILRGDLTFPESNEYGQLIQKAQKEIQAAPPIRGARKLVAYPGVQKGLGKPPKAPAVKVTKENMRIIDGKREPGMPISPDKQGQYLKETFGLSDKDLKALEKGKHKLPLAKKQPQQKKLLR